jgi:hypothetical protein
MNNFMIRFLKNYEKEIELFFKAFRDTGEAKSGISCPCTINKRILK